MRVSWLLPDAISYAARLASPPDGIAWQNVTLTSTPPAPLNATSILPPRPCNDSVRDNDAYVIPPLFFVSSNNSVLAALQNTPPPLPANASSTPPDPHQLDSSSTDLPAVLVVQANLTLPTWDTLASIPGRNFKDIILTGPLDPGSDGHSMTMMLNGLVVPSIKLLHFSSSLLLTLTGSGPRLFLQHLTLILDSTPFQLSLLLIGMASKAAEASARLGAQGLNSLSFVAPSIFIDRCAIIMAPDEFAQVSVFLCGCFGKLQTHAEAGWMIQMFTESAGRSA